MDYKQIYENWKSKELHSIEDLDIALDNFRILFAYHSNVMENPNTTLHNTREIFENGRIVNYTGDLRTLFEMNNQKECYEYLKPRIIAKEPLSSTLIKDVHEKLMHGCYDETRYGKGERPGEFKQHDYVVGDDIGVPYEDVPSEINFLCDEVNNYQGDDILTCASYFHLNFESIHPFADGNGRVGRTLLNFYLMTHGYPPTILYEEDKEQYYLSLALFDKTEEIQGFREFLVAQSIKTWTGRTPNGRKGIQTFLL